jgi:hypothetical protein
VGTNYVFDFESINSKGEDIWAISKRRDREGWLVINTGNALRR